jgi:hypothetical protein
MKSLLSVLLFDGLEVTLQFAGVGRTVLKHKLFDFGPVQKRTVPLVNNAGKSQPPAWRSS